MGTREWQSAFLNAGHLWKTQLTWSPYGHNGVSFLLLISMTPPPPYTQKEITQERARKHSASYCSHSAPGSEYTH